jgi:hypothetical protein
MFNLLRGNRHDASMSPLGAGAGSAVTAQIASGLEPIV